MSKINTLDTIHMYMLLSKETVSRENHMGHLRSSDKTVRIDELYISSLDGGWKLVDLQPDYHALRTALEQDELILQHQPVISVDQGKIIGYEALVRWQHPEAGLVGPGKFLPLAESTGLINEIGEWVLRTACAGHKQFEAQAHRPLQLAVNVSAHQVGDPRFVERTANALEESELDPKCLTLELTETARIHDTEGARKKLKCLSSMGIGVSLDDFGEGWSPMMYLMKLPVSSVKISHSFVAGAHQESEKRSVVNAIVRMAHERGARIVAEGVETIEDLRFARESDCDEMQGFWFSPPVASEEFGRTLQLTSQLSYTHH